MSGDTESSEAKQLWQLPELIWSPASGRTFPRRPQRRSPPDWIAALWRAHVIASPVDAHIASPARVHSPRGRHLRLTSSLLDRTRSVLSDWYTCG